MKELLRLLRKMADEIELELDASSMHLTWLTKFHHGDDRRILKISNYIQPMGGTVSSAICINMYKICIYIKYV